MKYWLIEKPQYLRGDTESRKKNGVGKYRYSMPGYRCEECGTYGGAYVLGLECPDSLRGRNELIDRWPISADAYLRLCAEVKQKLQNDVVLLPGSSFQPLKLVTEPSCRNVLIWPAIGSIVVRQDIKELFEREAVTGVNFFEVEMTSRKEKKMTGGSVLYNMVVIARSGLPSNFTIRSICKLCGREDILVPDHFYIENNLVPSDDVFYLGSTLRIVICDRVKELFKTSGVDTMDASFVNLPVLES